MMCSKRYKICIAYDGTAYAGWQMQPNEPSVQGTIQRALYQLVRADIKIHGSGRTDTGVHASGQVAHFDLERTFSSQSMERALNTYLPRDIRILNACEVHDRFHARKSAVGKEYRYFIWNTPVLLPTARLYHLHAPLPLDPGAMQSAADLLVGCHDFSAFTANPRRTVESCVRTVHSLNVRRKGDEIVIAVRGDGFLYKMVRSLAGWLVRVGLGEFPPAFTTEVLLSRERTARVPTAPPQGLFLWKVFYSDAALNAV